MSCVDVLKALGIRSEVKNYYVLRVEVRGYINRYVG